MIYPTSASSRPGLTRKPQVGRLWASFPSGNDFRWRARVVAAGLLAASFASATLAQTTELDPLPLSTEAAAVPAAPVAEAVPLTAADLEAWLDGLVPYALASGDIAGAQVVVVKDGEVLLARGYGHAAR